ETEAEFEEAVVRNLKKYGWDDAGGVLMHPTEQDLLDNWARILFENNREIDRLNGCPLTKSEMQQIVEQIIDLRTPMKLNGFINGKTVAVKRDNPDDKLHYGKEISLKIYDRREIAAGMSRYQIAQQPHFSNKSKILNERRGDLLLLINGMPVIHIELKCSGVSVNQACNQIEKYAHEGVFTNLLALVQIFVAMNPEETLYFANPGSSDGFNANYRFHWADFNNEPINDWQKITSSLLSIPMAHQLIGFYTVADDADGALKVMRSYQYYAANAISDKVAKTKWRESGSYGGFVWHTTGSGKTMTSFKSAQLIANSKDADKVVFLMDRIELGTQSLKEYRNFAEENESVQETEDTQVLKSKLKSKDPADVLIVTSIQKMSRIKDEAGGMSAHDIEIINDKRIVFIVDECHRSVFGDMLATIKNTFPFAIFFGFTGTPIQEENQKKQSTTAMVFGNELHRYSIADGIRDKNVLGFDPYMVPTYRDRDVRQAVALDKAHAMSPEEAIGDPRKSEMYFYFMDTSQVGMASKTNCEGKKEKGIEDCVPISQYSAEEHKSEIAEDICNNWTTLSVGGKFHAIFATSSISEAIEYYRLLKKKAPYLKITALFDPSLDNMGNAIYKEDGLVEIIEDYNELYGRDFTIATHAKMKKDISARLAHKKPYVGIERTPEKQIDILIVVDQMLTGFDSKWINTLYMDKIMEYESIIQAFSRTNRLFGPDKPFGTIRYYRKPHTMRKNIEDAVKLYSGDKPLALFVNKLGENLTEMNHAFSRIEKVFVNSDEPHFTHLPLETPACAEFAKNFKILNQYLDAARIQGFEWGELEYVIPHEDSSEEVVALNFDEQTYLTLALRYKELAVGDSPDSDSFPDEVPYDLEGYLTEIDTGHIDSDYMNLNFTKWLKALTQEGVELEAVEQLRNELCRSFAALTQGEQKQANIFLHDIERGTITLEPEKTLRDYITQYQRTAKDDQLNALVAALGVDRELLVEFVNADITENNINEYGRFDKLCAGVDKSKARTFFETQEGSSVPPFKVSMKIDKLLRDFVMQGGFDL
ncbi:MAG: HsdR family type I site-specific deoxyribonuclease, partial [Raoultibacter sp.]